VGSWRAGRAPEYEETNMTDDQQTPEDEALPEEDLDSVVGGLGGPQGVPGEAGLGEAGLPGEAV
jgi:hypothetical protein